MPGTHCSSLVDLDLNWGGGRGYTAAKWAGHAGGGQREAHIYP